MTFYAAAVAVAAAVAAMMGVRVGRNAVAFYAAAVVAATAARMVWARVGESMEIIRAIAVATNVIEIASPVFRVQVGGNESAVRSCDSGYLFGGSGGDDSAG